MMKNENLYGLKREINHRQEKLGIRGLADIGLDFKKGDCDVAEIAIKKVADQIIRAKIDSHKSIEDNIAYLENLISDPENITVKIEELDNGNEKRRLEHIVLCNNYSRKERLGTDNIVDQIKIATPVKVMLTDGRGNTIEFYSLLYAVLKKNMRGAYVPAVSKHNGKSTQYYNVCDLATGLAEAYIINELERYVKSNSTHMKLYIIAKQFQQGDIYPSLEAVEQVNSIKKEVNQPLIDSQDLHLGLGESGIKVYLEWLQEAVSGTKLFTLNNMYAKSDNRDGYNYTHLSHEKVSLFLKNLKEDTDTIKQECLMLREVSAAYAKSYVTKRNIPQKILDRMGTSKLLNHYSYIELDELTDLNKFSQFEDEVECLENLLKLGVAADHSLRLRRLGKQKSAGIYYRDEKAVCIDLESTYAYVHERMHMLDQTYTYQDDGLYLSSKYNFRSIIEKYKYLVDNIVERLQDTPEAHKIRLQFYGNNKFNRAYRFTPTEVFAVTGEIYCRRVLGIENSLLPGCYGCFYPYDDELIELIERYFSTLFESIREKRNGSNNTAVSQGYGYLDLVSGGILK